MTETLSLSRKAFRRGVDEALTLKPLRRVLSGYWTGSMPDDPTGAGNGKTSDTRSVTVAKSGRKSWHVKRSS